MKKNVIGWVSEFLDLLPKEEKKGLKTYLKRVRVFKPKILIKFVEKFLEKIEPKSINSITMWFTPAPEAKKDVKGYRYFETYTINITKKAVELRKAGETLLLLKKETRSEDKAFEVVINHGEGMSAMKSIFKQLL